ncbi:MAG: hypothetical protein AAFQ87_15085 [Bacteroidota bacterium]
MYDKFVASINEQKDKCQKSIEEIEIYESPLGEIIESARDISDSSSGSCLGDFAYLYLQNFKKREPHEYFDAEWGREGLAYRGLGLSQNRTQGNWVYYDGQQVQSEIFRRANLTKEHFDELHLRTNDIREVFEELKHELLVVVDALSGAEIVYLQKLRQEIQELESHVSKEQWVKRRISGRYITRDTIALQQGVMCPPHIGVEGWALSEISHILQTKELIKQSDKLIKYIEKKKMVEEYKVTKQDIAETASLKGKVHFGIVTIRPDEQLAMMEQLPKSSILDGQDERRYRISKIEQEEGPEIVVAVTRCADQGNIEAQKAASDMISDLDPQWILVVGIAGGVPEAEFSLGDVVISTRVYDLTLEASDPGGERKFSEKGESLHDNARRVIQDLPIMFASELAKWHESIVGNRPKESLRNLDSRMNCDDEDWIDKIRKSLKRHFTSDRPPIAIPGAIASSDRRVKDIEITKKWKETAKHFFAVEMELAGVFRTSRKIPVLGIRGISDIVGYERDEAWTAYSCKTAAAVASALIRSGLMPLKTQD